MLRQALCIQTRELLQRIGLQRPLLCQLGAYGLGLVNQRLYLRERIARGGAHLGAALEDAQRFLAAGNRALRQGQALIEAAQGQIVQRHLLDETGLNGMLRGIQRQIVAQGGIAETLTRPQRSSSQLLRPTKTS